MTISQTSKFGKFELSNRWALITGAAGLLGLEHSKALLEAGASVVLQDIDSDKLHQAKSILEAEYPLSILRVSSTDITSETEMRGLLKDLELEEIDISILINNAGINPKYNEVSNSCMNSRVENFELEDWDNQIRVGLTGAFICSKVFGGLWLNHMGASLLILPPIFQSLHPTKGCTKKQVRVQISSQLSRLPTRLLNRGLSALPGTWQLIGMTLE